MRSVRIAAGLAALASVAACGAGTPPAPAPAPAGAASSPAGAVAAPAAQIGGLRAVDPGFHALVPEGARLEQLAEGFRWSEGPLWRRDGAYLLFTDVPNNTMYRWKEGEGLSVFLRPAGYARLDLPGTVLSREGGSNGLTWDPAGRLVMADHGNRIVARLDETGWTKTAVVERFEGKRFNSPNDVVFHSNGDLYFTDPPYGLQGGHDSPHQELDFSGVYRLTAAGQLQLVTREMRYPNGIALSPDQRTLYVANSDGERPIIMSFPVGADGAVGAGRVFFDAAPLAGPGRPGVPDGMAVDARGNLFATGPGGVLVISPQGRHLGTIETPGPSANCKFGGEDGSTLFITNNRRLLRIRTATRGF